MCFEVKNIKDHTFNSDKGEFFEEIFRQGNVRVERILSNGQQSAEGFWYDQQEDEWVMLLEGSAAIECDNQHIIEMNAGDYLYIPARKKHRVKWTSSEPACIWLAVFITKQK